MTVVEGPPAEIPEIGTVVLLPLSACATGGVVLLTRRCGRPGEA